MGKDTGISWTDHTFNPWWGCTKVSPGCDHCYAEIVDSRYSESSHWGKGSPRRTFGEKHWNEPLKWNAQAIADGTRPRVFCASMGDVNDDEAPEGERERLHRLINATSSLFWLLLTKRPSRFLRYLPSNGFAHDNVMLMATVEMQEFYAPRINALHTAASVLHTRNDLLRRNAKPILTGISYEPALGPLSIRQYPGIRPHWVIFGGETGTDRRPLQEQWARDIKAECEEFGIPFFMKQMSAYSTTQAAKLIPGDMLLRQYPRMPA